MQMSTVESPLVRSLRELGKLSVLDYTLPEMLERIVAIANEAVAPSTMAGLTLDVAGMASTAASTDEAVAEIDEAQYRPGGAGPCLDSARHGLVFAIPSTTEDRRWPEFSARCAANGIHSTVSAPVVARSAKRAALNLYAATDGAFGSDDVELAEAFAKQAAVAIENAEAYYSVKQLAEQLQVALDTRIVIEQAKGLLMAKGCSPEEAFDVLKSRSQSANRKLRDIAADVVADAERRRLRR
jgi:GAF domain-containing protein